MSFEAEIRKSFSGFTLDVKIQGGKDRLGLLGASGCGKSMTLRCLAGIEKPDTGRIVIDGQVVFDSVKGINLPPQKRKVGYLFQHYALFPTMTVQGNLGIVLRRLPKPERQKRIQSMLERLGLADLAGRYPSQLSGGQQQRVALARMLVSEPSLIMLDEPLSALDSFLRSQVEQELLESLEGFEGSVIFVSHDRDEVYRVCQDMVVLDAGRVVASGDRASLFGNPRTVSAARLTGCKNIAPVRLIGPHRLAVPSWGVVLDTDRELDSTITHVGIRSHHVRSARPGDINVYPFVVRRLSQAPFTITEYLFALTPPGSAGQETGPRAELRRDLAEQATNLRQAGGDESTLPTDARLEAGDPGNRTVPLAKGRLIELCLPPEHLLLLGG